MAANIRQWAPAVLRDAAANDDEGAECMTIKITLRYLDGLVHTLSTPTAENLSRGHFKPDFLLKRALTSRKLRQQGKLAQLATDHFYFAVAQAIGAVVAEVGS